MKKCAICIHENVCSRKTCEFVRDWKPDELEKRFYIVDKNNNRLDDELYSIRDREEEFDGNVSFIEKSEWEKRDTKKFRVRISITTPVNARDEMEARSLACRDSSPQVECDILHKYRMPVQYLCCEEGRTWGFEYTEAANPLEAKYHFMNNWIPDVESSPCFDDLEEYDPQEHEWYPANVGRE